MFAHHALDRRISWLAVAVACFVALPIVNRPAMAQGNECQALLKPDVFAYSQSDTVKIAWFKAFDQEKSSNDFQAFVTSVGGSLSDSQKFDHIQQQENYTYDKEDSKWLLISKLPPEAGANYLKCLYGREGLVIEDYAVDDDRVNVTLAWYPPPEKNESAQVTWQDASGKRVTFADGSQFQIAPSATKVFSFPRDPKKTLDIFATTSVRSREFRVPAEAQAVKEPKAKDVITSLRSNGTCWAIVSGTSSLDRLIPGQTYTISVQYNPSSPQTSKWISVGNVSGRSDGWSKALSVAWDRGIGDPADRVFWVVSVPFKLQDDGTIVAAMKATDGSAWKGAVTCDINQFRQMLQ
jgi:hypothetical protein